MGFPSATWELFYQEDAEVPLKRFCARHGLLIKEMQSKGIPDSRHWHVSKPGEKGVLEFTLENRAKRFWMSLRSNRQGAWTEEAAIAAASAMKRPVRTDLMDRHPEAYKKDLEILRSKTPEWRLKKTIELCEELAQLRRQTRHFRKGLP